MSEEVKHNKSYEQGFEEGFREGRNRGIEHGHIQGIEQCIGALHAGLAKTYEAIFEAQKGETK
jgi:hypothetical protein